MGKESLEKERTSEAMQLCRKVEAVLARYLQTECYEADAHRGDRSTCSLVAKTGYFVRELDFLGIWPIIKAVRTMSLQEISTQLKKFQNDHANVTINYDVACENFKINCKKLLRRADENTLKSYYGLCLNCVKKGNIMTADGNCKATSLELCKNLFTEASI